MFLDDSPAQGLNRKDRTWESQIYYYKDQACLWFSIGKSMILQVKEGNDPF